MTFDEVLAQVLHLLQRPPAPAGKTEGLDTADRQAARTLLEAVG